MTAPKSPAGYPDCRLFLDKALEAKKGGRLIFLDYSAAWSFRMRCYNLRARQSEQNRKIYKDDPSALAHGATAWDGLKLVLEELERDGDARWVISAIHDDKEAMKKLGATYEDIE